MRRTKILTKSERTKRKEKIVSFMILLLVCVIWSIPILYMVGTSFKSGLDLQTHPETLFPSSLSEWTLEHYTGFIIRDGKIDNMPIWMLNSLWSTAVTVLLTVLFDLVTAYAVVFLKFRGKETFVKFLILWMTVPGIIGTVPSYVLYTTIKSSLGVTGTTSYIYMYGWMIISGVTGIYNFLLMRSFFASIPRDIIDSAKSDGASQFLIFKKIVCPLAKSTMMLIVLFQFTNGWNALVFPRLIMTGEDTYWQTLTVALTGYTGSSTWGTTGVRMATSVFAMIPIMIIFAFTQNKMIDGIATTGIKE